MNTTDEWKRITFNGYTAQEDSTSFRRKLPNDVEHQIAYNSNYLVIIEYRTKGERK